MLLGVVRPLCKNKCCVLLFLELLIHHDVNIIQGEYWYYRQATPPHPTQKIVYVAIVCWYILVINFGG